MTSVLRGVNKNLDLVYSLFEHKHHLPHHMHWKSVHSQTLADQIGSIYELNEYDYVIAELYGFRDGKSYDTAMLGPLPLVLVEEQIRRLPRDNIPMNYFSLYTGLLPLAAPLHWMPPFRKVPAVYVLAGPMIPYMPLSIDDHDYRGAIIVRCHDIERAKKVHDHLVNCVSPDSF